MRVLILGGSNSRNSGGVFNSARNLGINLKRQNIDVNFLMYDDEYSSIDRREYQEVCLRNYKVFGPRNFGFSFNLLNQIREIAPDIIHVQTLWMHLSNVNNIYHKKNRTPYIISPRGMLDSWQLNQSFTKDLKKQIALWIYEGRHLKNSICLHALCQEEYHSIREFGLTNPVAIIPNGVEMPNKLIKKQVNNTGKKTLLFISRIHPKKGLNNLLEGWALLNNFNHDWVLQIAGETKDENYIEILKAKCINLNISNSVIFLGGVFGTEKEIVFQNADAFILPSFSEGLPMAVLEAWSYGLPSLITPQCNLNIGFEQNASIEIDTSPEGIAKGIEKLIFLNNKEISIMCDNARRLVEKNFVWSKVARMTIDLYRWALDKNEPLPPFVQLD